MQTIRKNPFQCLVDEFSKTAEHKINVQNVHTSTKQADIEIKG
jgi:hypothetical protein